MTHRCKNCTRTVGNGAKTVKLPMVSAYIRKNKVWTKIGYFCPVCGYFKKWMAKTEKAKEKTFNVEGSMTQVKGTPCNFFCLKHNTRCILTLSHPGTHQCSEQCVGAIGYGLDKDGMQTEGFKEKE